MIIIAPYIYIREWVKKCAIRDEMREPKLFGNIDRHPAHYSPALIVLICQQLVIVWQLAIL